MRKKPNLRGTEMTYTWKPAGLADVDDIVKMAEQHFQREIDLVFTPEPPAYARNLAYAVFNQTYYPGSELLAVARDDSTNQLLAYNWAKGGDRTWWSDDTMVNVRMVHLDMTMPARQRVKLINEMRNPSEINPYPEYYKKRFGGTSLPYNNIAISILHCYG